MSTPGEMLKRPPRSLEQLHRQVVACRRCPRLRGWCRQVAREKKRAFAGWTYCGQPVPGFGDGRARLWIIGLAPAAHGANRTGRIFTGDRSGDFLFAALHRTGYANQATSVRIDDGLTLTDCYISATARCAPPGNKPTPIEISNCAPFLDAEWRLLARKRVILALGGIAWDAALQLAARHGASPPRRKPKFAHAAEHTLSPGVTLIGSYHVSQQNTFTGRLTPAMFDAVLNCSRALSIEQTTPALK
jgi:uracil-DNA glycosylase family 4